MARGPTATQTTQNSDEDDDGITSPEPPSGVSSRSPAAEARQLGEDLAGIDGVRARFMLITPELAVVWLKRNDANRLPSRATILKYAAEMKALTWTLNSCAVTFSPGGVLLNGQNRLHACVQSGTPFPSLVIFGMPEETFLNEDTARRRSRKDRLDIGGEERTGVLADAIGWLFAWQENALSRVGQPNPSPAQEAALIEKHPGLRRSVDFVSKNGFGTLGKLGMFAMLHYVASRKDEALADLFFEALGRGAALSETDPVYHLRKKMIDDRVSTRKMSRPEKVAYVIKAWNLTKAGKRCRSRLKWGPADGFPRFQ